MKNLIKIICLTFVIILECQCLLANGYKKDRVAIVGNSLASNFAYYNNIEGENITVPIYIGELHRHNDIANKSGKLNQYYTKTDNKSR